MGVSWIAAVGFATAVAAQVAVLWWLGRIYPTIPPKIPYGTVGNRYFWYGPRAVVWLAPLAFLAILAFVGVTVMTAPPLVRAQPWFALPFFLMAAATPLVMLAINDKINAARRQQQ